MAKPCFDLCRLPIVWPDLIEERAGGIELAGWIIARPDILSSGEMTMNSKPATSFTRLPADDVVRAQPWCEGNAIRFTATFDQPRAETSLRFSYAPTGLPPYNRWQSICFPPEAWRQGVVVPPGEAMQRTQGNRDVSQYVALGASVAQLLDDVSLAYFGRRLNAFGEICDWGCGCGRLAQAVHRIAPSARLWGSDIDPENTRWCQKNLLWGTFREAPLWPPMPFEDGQFDLLFGISVFTHLHRAAFVAWRDELCRVVRPGGAVLVTLHGEASLAVSGNKARIARTLSAGFDDAQLDPALNDYIADKEYYRATFITEGEARRLFAERFIVRDVIPQANAHQDLVVCQRP
jgi:SAM-dependent methyltransferase